MNAGIISAVTIARRSTVSSEEPRDDAVFDAGLLQPFRGLSEWTDQSGLGLITLVLLWCVPAGIHYQVFMIYDGRSAAGLYSSGDVCWHDERRPSGAAW